MAVWANGELEPTEPVASRSTASERYAVDDAVLVVSTSKTPHIVVITALWEMFQDGDGVEDGKEGPSEFM